MREIGVTRVADGKSEKTFRRHHGLPLACPLTMAGNGYVRLCKQTESSQTVKHRFLPVKMG